MARQLLLAAGFDVTGEATPLSDAEIEVHRGTLEVVIERTCIALDLLLTHVNKEHVEADVWSEMSPEMRSRYANAILRRASHVGWLAKAVRQVESAVAVRGDAAVATDLAKRLVASGLFVGNNGGFSPWLN